MPAIGIAIAALALYGDLLKRVLPPTVSLSIMYALACFGLLANTAQRAQISGATTSAERCFYNGAAFLVGLYVFQLLNLTGDIVSALGHALYMSIPLMYIIVMRNRVHLDGIQIFINAVLLLVIPVNFIGLIQALIDSQFFISSVYTNDELGGAILRNTFDGSYFTRHPSVFASADRYSSVALMQFYIALICWLLTSRRGIRFAIWIAFNIGCSVVALLISGARSRLMIVGFSVVAAALLHTFSSSKKPATEELKAPIDFLWRLVVSLLLFWTLLFALYFWESIIANFPVLDFFSQSAREADFGTRFTEALVLSLPDSETLGFGEGLGTVNFGKPGEFGIHSIWIESGWFYGLLLLLSYILMLLGLFLRLLYAAVQDRPLEVVIISIPFLQLCFALMTGFTSMFELSTGLILGMTLPAVMRVSKQELGGSSFRLDGVA